MRLGSSNLLLITAVATLVHDGTNVACKESGWINTGTGMGKQLLQSTRTSSVKTIHMSKLMGLWHFLSHELTQL